MQSPPFGILGINNNNPCHASNPLQRQQTQEQDKPDNSLLSWSWTLPLGLANAEEKEEKEAQKQRLQERQEKSTLLGRRSSCSSWHWWHSSGTSHSWCWWQWCFCRLFSSSVRQSRKRQWGRNGCGSSCCKKTSCRQPLPSWLLQHPSLQHTSTQLPKGSATRHNTTHQEWIPQLQEKRDRGRIQDIWLGRHQWRPLVCVPIFTFWKEQVNKCSMPELDMDHNYIGLYKTHEDMFQIMLTLKPKRPAPKKK